MTFQLAPGIDESTFRAVDGRVQTEFAYHQPGLLRRTLGRRGAQWLVLQVWASVEAAQRAFDASPLGSEFMALVDSDSLSVERYEGVD